MSTIVIGDVARPRPGHGSFGIEPEIRDHSATSGRPDQNISRIFLGLSKLHFTWFFSVEFSQAGGPDSQVV